MGMKHRFRLSDMIPNAWFYKLKDMSKSSNHNHLKKRPPPPSSSSTVAAAAATRAPRYSCYFSGRAANHHHHHHHKLYNSPVNQKATDTHFPDPPRRSSSSSRRRKAIYKPSPKLLSPPPPSSSSVCSKCRDCNDDAKSTLDYSTSPFESSPDFCPSFLTSDDEEEDEEFAPASFEDQVASAAWSASARSCHSCKVSSSSADIIIDVNGQNSSCGRNIKKLPPIVTKPSKMDHVKAQRTKSRPSTTPRKSTSKRNHSATGIRLKANSPRRLAGRKLQGGNRKSPVTTCLSAAGKRIGESFAVVKSSVDPEKDFMESMVEMIVENGIRSSRQLEDLLACYLSLNSTKYHEAIVRAFEQIWFHMS